MHSFFHRRHVRGEAKTWGRVSLIGVIVLLLPVTAQGLTRTASCFTVGQAYDEPLTREALVDLTNTARTEEGLSALRANRQLDAIAEERARDMVEGQYFGHVSPTGDRVALVAARIGYKYSIIAENLATGAFRTNLEVIEAWLHSPGHRKNILFPQLKEIGTSVVRGRMNGMETWVIVQVFGIRSMQPSLASFSANRVRSDDFQTETVGARLRTAHQELDAEREAIERDRRAVIYDPMRKQEINARINAYNGKADRYNQSLAKMKEIITAQYLTDR
jgi:uncharacterized protein YkwD